VDISARAKYLREHYRNLKIYVVESDATAAIFDLFVK